VNQASTAPHFGNWKWELTTGQLYQVGIFEEEHGPLSQSPDEKVSLRVLCILKNPERARLITDEQIAIGGTWSWHHTHTSEPTNIVLIGVSRKGITKDPSNGFPELGTPEGAPLLPFTLSTDHKVELRGLIAGQSYTYLVVVANAAGQWDFREGTFTTLRRKLTVVFTFLNVINDGDPFAVGEAEFWFQLFHGDPRKPRPFATLHRPQTNIDDSRPVPGGFVKGQIPLGLAHVGNPAAVQPGEEGVWVRSWGVEEDGIFEADEMAMNVGMLLEMPSGRNVETILGHPIKITCPAVTADDDFTYSVDMLYFVEYVP
jgi:hypothetical protein